MNADGWEPAGHSNDYKSSGVAGNVTRLRLSQWCCSAPRTAPIALAATREDCLMSHGVAMANMQLKYNLLIIVSHFTAAIVFIGQPKLGLLSMFLVLL